MNAAELRRPFVAAHMWLRSKLPTTGFPDELTPIHELGRRFGRDLPIELLKRSSSGDVPLLAGFHFAMFGAHKVGGDVLYGDRPMGDLTRPRFLANAQAEIAKNLVKTPYVFERFSTVKEPSGHVVLLAHLQVKPGAERVTFKGHAPFSLLDQTWQSAAQRRGAKAGRDGFDVG